MRRPFTIVLAGVIALTFAGGVATATSKAHTTAKACVSSKGALALLHKGKCPKKTSAITVGRGPAGPRGASGIGPAYEFRRTSDGEVTVDNSDTYESVLSLSNLPAGDYDVVATVTLLTSSGTDQGMDCQLYVNHDGGLDGTIAAYVPLNVPANGEVEITLNAAVAPGAAPRDLVVGCSAGGTEAWGTLVATRVSSITQQQPLP